MLNGESLDVPDASYDLVVVQDGCTTCRAR
jgi:hypothetical protein